MYEAAGDKDTQPSLLAVQTEGGKAKQSLLSLPLLKIVTLPGILRMGGWASPHCAELQLFIFFLHDGSFLYLGDR